MRARFQFLGEDFEVAPLARRPQVVVAVNGTSVELGAVDFSAIERGRVQVVLDGKVHVAHVARDRDGVHLHLDGETWTVATVDPIAAAGGGGATSDAIHAPMPGVVVTTAVAVGAAVTEGQTLLVIESMKLQTAIVADRAGRIAALPVGDGASFDKGAELVRFEPADAAADGGGQGE